MIFSCWYFLMVRDNVDLANIYLLTAFRLNTISVFCAQLTAKCENLTSDWLGLLRSLCCSSNRNCGFVDILTQIDVSCIIYLAFRMAVYYWLYVVFLPPRLLFDTVLFSVC